MVWISQIRVKERLNFPTVFGVLVRALHLLMVSIDGFLRDKQVDRCRVQLASQVTPVILRVFFNSVSIFLFWKDSSKYICSGSMDVWIERRTIVQC
jgi:hypothetical protein